jgi:hypothetical protein
MKLDSIPSIRRFAAGILAAACISVFAACSQTQIREERYEDGARKSRTAFLRKSDEAMLRHGVQMSWYPSGGKESMETYVNGYRQGYAFRWHPNGRMKSIEHYTDGMRDGQAKFWDEVGNITACFAPDAEDCLRPSDARASAGEHPSSSRFASTP